MSFSIVFMYNNEPMNKIGKTPETKFTLEGTLKEESSIVDPVILIEKDNPIEANYAYIAEFERYYYIKDISKSQARAPASLRAGARGRAEKGLERVRGMPFGQRHPPQLCL